MNEFLLKLINKNQKSIIINKKTLGPGLSRNKGISLSRKIYNIL